jgi:CRP-like cAMP-binding protein
MSRCETGFDQSARSAFVASQIHKGIVSMRRELALPEVKPHNEGLTNKILASLPASELRRLVPFLEPVTLYRGAELIRSNESNHFVYFPESAVISHYYLLRNGGTTAAAVIGNDGVVSLSTMFESRPPLYSTRVMIGGVGLRVKPEVIRQEFARGESVQRLILAYMSKRLSQVSQRAVCNGRHKLAERLRNWLLMIDDRAEDRVLPLTHADIANHLGARRAVISGCCHALRARGVIDYRRGHIIILDRKTLEQEACECYQVLSESN